MARKPHDVQSPSETEPPKTLAEMLYYLPNSKQRDELEQYRREYEAIYGGTDLTLRYTSTWPHSQQNWLIANDIKRYFDGLPAFVRAYIKGKMQLAACVGNLDDMPTSYLRLFVAGQMRVGEPKP